MAAFTIKSKIKTPKKQQKSTEFSNKSQLKNITINHNKKITKKITKNTKTKKNTTKIIQKNPHHNCHNKQTEKKIHPHLNLNRKTKLVRCSIPFRSDFLHLVPGAPPRNITAMATSPTTISVSWLPPPVERANGRIIYYKVFFVEVGRADSEATIMTLNKTHIVLDELKRWTEYKIWTLAGTSVGDGPRSHPIIVRTHEDGMYCLLGEFDSHK